ncbi:MAG: hypothetical protein A2015_11435 [Spirochaetes bacterium GWF1_31_7]|nr:MAG: hypothetical protein A2Y30_15640 [Spirochaetes bacterium GWE1_32_154]OHD49035.1 MAG: hypothetical protein A2015_11435 [Spirochaetes bacterium GWF1_31_7]OHD50381.1 MAG: hypothetical protein A2Y29_13690 [Spirochaetes bacterium GWE2_31_10]OHD75725.1 MAG: hypothetical protein A2355_00440 [Spirochaetes bacterium RIFOXYB1_FULL_32_8]
MKANLLRNKVIIVTGGDSELSQKLALEIALSKSEVILIGKKKENLEKPVKVLENIKKKSGRISPVVCDWHSVSDIEKSILIMKKIAGGFDILVFNGINPVIKKIDDITNADIEKVIDKDLKFNLIFIKLLIKELKSAKKPSIITISDFTESVGIPYFSLTNIASYAYNGFFESARRELSGEKIKFMSVRVPMSKETFSDECGEKLGKLGFSENKTDLEVKAIIEGFNDEKPVLLLDKKEKGTIFSNKFSNRSVDNKFKTIKTKLLNAISSNE